MNGGFNQQKHGSNHQQHEFTAYIHFLYGGTLLGNGNGHTGLQ
jgi:hypothetical protein